MDWHKSVDEKPKSNRPVLGYWQASGAFLMVVYLTSNSKWWATTGGQVSQPICWAIPEPPPW